MHKNFSSEKKLPCKKNKKDEISSQFAVKAFETQKPNLPNDFQKIAAKKGLVPRVAKNLAVNVNTALTAKIHLFFAHVALSEIHYTALF